MKDIGAYQGLSIRMNFKMFVYNSGRKLYNRVGFIMSVARMLSAKKMAPEYSPFSVVAISFFFSFFFLFFFFFFF